MANPCEGYGIARYGVSVYCPTTPVDHTFEAREQVWNRFKRCPNFDNLARIIGHRFQLLSNELEDIRAIRSVDTDTGANLDALGALQGQAREGFSDLVYRSLIKAKTIANRSKGTSEEIITAARFLRFGDDSEIAFTQLFPAALSLEFTSALETLQHQTLIADLLFQTKLGGVRMFVLFVPVTPFGFAGDAGAFGFGTGIFSTLYSS
jgi:hypothetical protein